ncbi:MAG TPA: class III extradiol ring-cleavage dioxygenase [Rhizomicrobium sp.]|nr:class III extradiol ring-cleavage dioxygenase [Rhizomicrobium sp.]
MLPAIFVSHGAPTLPFDDVPARDFLRGLGAELGRPRAVLAVSAHWDTDAPATNAVSVNDTIHDFHGFPRPLYDLRYPAPGDALLAREVGALLSGFGAQTDTMRGLDHGAWVPLMLMYPDAGIPVVQLSVQSGNGAGHHLALGRALAGLRQDNVLVMGSGGFVHNLRQIAPPGTPEAPWSQDFAGWMHEKLIAGDEAALADYRARAPHAAMAHPTDEHLMPLFVAYGAGGENTKAARLHSSATFGSLRMDAYSFA